MRAAAALLLAWAALDWPALWLDRAGVALLGLAAIALALPAAPRRRARLVERARGPALLEQPDELEPDVSDLQRRIFAATGNGGSAA